MSNARATQSSVTVERTGETILLTIRDNGQGFAPYAPMESSPYAGFGLTGISERAQLLGGRATIESAPGRGTTISIELHTNGSRHE